MNAVAWDELSKAERDEVTRLHRRHRDIAKHGAEALRLEAEKRELQERRQAWVLRYGLRCFKCHGTLRDWAAGGKTNGRLWVICTDCVRKPR